MLMIAETLESLDFEQLMDIYIEGNRENAEDQWPELPTAEGLERAKQGFRKYLETGFFTKPGAWYMVWEMDGKYVSALRLEPYEDGFLMEALETIPGERKKGYASQLIRAVQVWMGHGKIYSHVSKRNEASLAIHARCGFQKHLDYSVYTDGTVNEKAYTMCYEA